MSLADALAPETGPVGVVRRTPCADPELTGLSADDWADDGPRNVEAAEFCALCPVRVECLDMALDSREQYGVWGGLTASERKRMVRRERRGRRSTSTYDRSPID